MSRRDGLRPAATDHLTALAARFQPERGPWWDWESRAWWWVGPTGLRERLGSDWSEAHLTLERLGRQLDCPHGRPLVGAPCGACRESIVTQLELPATG